MVKFLKLGKAVILLQGRYAGKNAVIVRVFDEGTRDRPYGHCLVVGLAKYPKKVICRDSSKKTTKKSCVKEVVSSAPDSLTTKDKNLTAAKSAKAKLEERFKTGKNKWFFTKLRMIRDDSTCFKKCQQDLFFTRFDMIPHHLA
ncbi:60S ribosomal protein L27-3 [Hordeum vulgare]|nr:60S ribosomal protein L27-3 [Hordeum vulgare]